MLRHRGADRTARVLLEAVTHRGQEFVHLTHRDREAILSALERPPEGLVELRGALFSDLNWRRRGGL